MAKPNANNPHTLIDESQLLFELINQQLIESNIAVSSVTLDSSIADDLGFDSLGRVELISRIERVFNVALPERIYINAETPRDLLRAVHDASTSHSSKRKKDIETLDLGLAQPAPHSANTLIETLRWHVSRHAQRPHIHLYNGSAEFETITFQQLYDNAVNVAAGLQSLGVVQGEPVTIMLPTSFAYFYTFYGILLAGGIPVPLYPPANPAQLEDHMRRHVGILSNCKATTLITVPEAKKIAHLLKTQVDELKHIVTIDDLTAANSKFNDVEVGPESIAFIQYTSGSTGSPKGVVLTHENLLANIRVMGQTAKASSEDVFVSWLPLYHDMGLIGAWLGSLYFASLFVVMSPLTFLRRPEQWLWAIHQFKGTMSAAPNFGYELCIRRLSDEQLENLNLRSWRAAFNGAEAVSPNTLDRFSDRFSKYGLKREILMPVYGLAENSLGLTFPPLNRGPLFDKIQRDPFSRYGQAIKAQLGDQSALQFVACGYPLSQHQIRIVDNTNRELPERQEGRLQFHGPSSTSGYFRNPKETKRLFNDEWLNSGDLAYIAEGEIYLTGRVKDIIIRAGRNIYPHELEESVGNIPGIRAGRVAAFGSKDKNSGTERLIILAESHISAENQIQNLRKKVNNVVNALAGTPPDEIVFAPPNTVLKTSSGKLRRAASRELYEHGNIGKKQKAVWRQILHFMYTGFSAELHKYYKAIGSLIYGVSARSSFWILALLTWLLVVLTPVLAWRWRIMKRMSQFAAKLNGIKVRIEGNQHLLSNKQSCIYVANHASYLDALAIIIAIPDTFSFVAKAELRNHWFAKTFLTRINAAFAERFDVEKGIQDFRKITEHAKQGHSLFFFPEGTFTRKPGLRPFHMGAFIAAAEVRLPIVPITIRGTRSILRPQTWLPHKGAVNVIISKPIHVEDALSTAETGEKWHVAKTLRDTARKSILHNCGEPDLRFEPHKIENS